MTIRELKAEILGSFASIHAFCKAHPELPRASVYLLLSGKYPGNGQRQIARIHNVLTNNETAPSPAKLPDVTSAMFCDELQQVRCANCRRLARRECPICRDNTAREGLELYARLYNIKNIGNVEDGNQDPQGVDNVEVESPGYSLSG